MHFVRSLSKYSAMYIETIIKECGGIDAIFICMKDFDMNVRESALQAINAIARQGANISLYIVSSGKSKFIYQTKLLFTIQNYMNINLHILKTYMIHIIWTFIFTGVLLPLINLCLKEPQQNLRLYALSTLDEFAKQNQDLAQIIVDVPTLPHVAHLLSSNITDVKVQVY